MAAHDHTLQVGLLVDGFDTSSDTRFSEVAFVGKAIGTYAMLLGGGYYGQRLNKIYRGSLFYICPWTSF